MCVPLCVPNQKVHTMNVNTNIILETRKPRSDGKYPVKLRLTYKRERHYTKKRMPLILDDEGWRQWVDPKTTKEEIQALLKPSSNEILSYHTISKDISHRNIDSNYPEIQKEVLYPEIDNNRVPNTLF